MELLSTTVEHSPVIRSDTVVTVASGLLGTLGMTTIVYLAPLAASQRVDAPLWIARVVVTTETAAIGLGLSLHRLVGSRMRGCLHAGDWERRGRCRDQAPACDRRPVCRSGRGRRACQPARPSGVRKHRGIGLRMPGSRPLRRADLPEGTMNHLLQLFYSEHCPMCPEAQQRVRQFAAARSDVTLVERDVAIAVGLARHNRLTATPAIVIEGGRTIYEVPPPETLAALMYSLQ